MPATWPESDLPAVGLDGVDGQGGALGRDKACKANGKAALPRRTVRPFTAFPLAVRPGVYAGFGSASADCQARLRASWPAAGQRQDARKRA